MWSRDGRYLYFQTYDVPDPAVYRGNVANRVKEKLADIQPIDVTDNRAIAEPIHRFRALDTVSVSTRKRRRD